MNAAAFDTPLTLNTPLARQHADFLNTHAGELAAMLEASVRAAKIRKLAEMLPEIERLHQLGTDETLPEEETDEHYAEYWLALAHGAALIAEITNGEIDIKTAGKDLKACWLVPAKKIECQIAFFLAPAAL